MNMNVIGKNVALLIIDVQNDFCPGGSLAVAEGDKIISPLNEIIEYAKKNDWDVIASRDWHPRLTKHFKECDPENGTWPVHCVRNTPGADFKRELQLPEKAIIISKGLNDADDGYSPFEGVELSTMYTLDQVLKYMGVNTLIIGGLATDYCVKAGVLDALKLGYELYLLEDAIRAVNAKSQDDGAEAIAEMVAAGAILINSKEVLNEN